MIEIKVNKVNDDVELPRYAKDGDVGMDVKAISCRYDEKYDYYEYDTGLICESGREIGWFAFSRSSNSKTDCYLCNGVGTIDSFGYRGHIMLRFKNRTSLEQLITNEVNERLIRSLIKGEKDIDMPTVYFNVREELTKRAKNLDFAPYEVGAHVGQLIALRCETVKIIEEPINMNTERGKGGFGHTGK